MRSLTGQLALITGGGRGIGRALAQAFAEAGAAVSIVARSQAEIDQVAQAIAASGGRAASFAVDVTDRAAIEHAVQQTEQRFGPVDILINNAGALKPLGPMILAEPDAWWRCIEVNLRGPFVCSQAVVPGMCQRGRGRVINMASSAGTRPYPNVSAYAISKAALIRFTEQLAVESLDQGVSVFGINPGPVRTAMTTYLTQTEEGRRLLPAYTPHFEASEGPVERVAELALRLAHGDADGLTGRTIDVLDDLDRLVACADEVERDNLYTLRLQTLGPTQP